MPVDTEANRKRDLATLAGDLCTMADDVDDTLDALTRELLQARADVADLRRHYAAYRAVVAAMKPCVRPSDDGPAVLVPDVVELRHGIFEQWSIVEADLGKG